jgi:hypothetical protein
LGNPKKLEEDNMFNQVAGIAGLATLIAIGLVSCDIGPVGMASLEAPQSQEVRSVAVESTLDNGEQAHLVFMREEEKLARDVYLTLLELWPEQVTFASISSSEQRHTDTMAAKLVQFGIEDPNPDTNDLPDSIGVFTGEDYGAYFTAKFDELVTAGSKSDLAALYVGALIEELDMDDIVNCPKAIVLADNGIEEGECGMAYTDEPPLQRSYGSLVEGSKNHLRAFVRVIEEVIGEGNYQAQYLTQEEVDDILGR